jgi:hypothetical protein
MGSPGHQRFYRLKLCSVVGSDGYPHQLPLSRQPSQHDPYFKKYVNYRMQARTTCSCSSGYRDGAGGLAPSWAQLSKKIRAFGAVLESPAMFFPKLSIEPGQPLRLN